MRFFSIVFCVIFCTLPGIIAAQGVQSSLDALCQGYTGDPSGVDEFPNDGKTTAAQMSQYLTRKVQCPSACYDVHISISYDQAWKYVSIMNNKLGAYLEITTTTTGNKCKQPHPDEKKLKSVFTPLPAPNEERSCKNGKGLPSITVESIAIPNVLPEPKRDGPKTRCDPKLAQVITSFSTQNLQQGFAQAGQIADPSATQVAPPTTPVTRPPEPPPVVKPPEVPVPSTSATEAALQTKLGMTPADAKTLVQSEPAKAADLIAKVAAGDRAGAQTLATELKLNGDVMQSIAAMSAPGDEYTKPPEVTPLAPPTTGGQITTFPPEPPPQAPPKVTQCGIAGTEGGIMYAESRCAQLNRNKLSSVRGPYHFLCETWNAYAKATGNSAYTCSCVESGPLKGTYNGECSYVDDVEISSRVMKARLEQFATQYGEKCTKGGIALEQCQYAIHVFGERGFQGVYNSYLTDPNASALSLCGPGRALSNRACNGNLSIFTKGGTVAGVFGELGSRLGIGSRQMPYPTGNASPFTGFTSTGGTRTEVTSPFRAANIFSFLDPQRAENSNEFTGGTNISGNTSLFSFLSGFLNGSPGFKGLQNMAPKANQTQVTPSQQNPQPQAVVSIVAQPQNVLAGNNILVSWSSVGMSAAQQCTTLMLTRTSTTTIGTTNEGSKVLTTSEPGILRFTISCTSLSGNTITSASAVGVQ